MLESNYWGRGTQILTLFMSEFASHVHFAEPKAERSCEFPESDQDLRSIFVV